VVGTRTAIEAAHRAGVKRIVHVSTSGTVAVSEDPDHVAVEDDPTPLGLIQRWPYYRTKLFAEQTALELGERLAGLTVVVVNPTLLLGPGDVRGSSTDDVRRFLERKIPAVPPGGLSFVDVRDAAATTVTALERGAAGRRYLLGACNLSLRAFFDKLERASGVPAPRLDLPRVRGLDGLLSRVASRLERVLGTAALDPVSLEMAFCFWYLDASRAEHELDFSPRDPMDTLLDTVEDLRGRNPLPGVSPWSSVADEVSS
jgi:dihydroflavonol-4-reductase